MIAGALLCALLGACGVLLLLRVADHVGDQPRDHLLILAVAGLACGVCIRFLDALQHLEVIRWSAPLGAGALLAFLLVDRRAHRRRTASR